MTGAELKLLCTLNNVKAYDIANALGFSHGTMTRLCQPSKVIGDDMAKKIVKAIRDIKSRDKELVTSVDLSKSLPED